jgi:hypothetical protein
VPERGGEEEVGGVLLLELGGKGELARGHVVVLEVALEREEL